MDGLTTIINIFLQFVFDIFELLINFLVAMLQLFLDFIRSIVGLIS